MDVDGMGSSSGGVDDPNGSSTQILFDQMSYISQGRVHIFNLGPVIILASKFSDQGRSRS